MTARRLPGHATMLRWQTSISILITTVGVLISPALSQGHEAENFINRCKIFAESTVTQTPGIRYWDINESFIKSSVMIFLKFRQQYIDEVREVFCTYSRETSQLEYLIIDGNTIPVRDGEADQELLLELKR